MATATIRKHTQTHAILDRLAKKGHTAAELADVSSKPTARTAVYGLLNRLEERGLVTKTPKPGRSEDGQRTVNVYTITKAGRAARKG